MATIIGRIEPFDPKEEEWLNYVERLEQFFLVNSIEDSKKVSALLTLVGRETYGLLKDLCAPSKPDSLNYDELVAKIKNHYSPVPNVVAERKRFSGRRRKSGETVAEYVASLRNLSKLCNFGSNLEERLRDQLVEGINDESILKRLLAKPDLTFADAVKVATAMETAEKDSQHFKGNASENVNVLSSRRVQHKKKAFGSARPEKEDASTCSRCGMTNHKPHECRAVNRECFNCHKKGHYARHCRMPKKTASETSFKSKPHKWKTHYVEADADEEQEASFFRLGKGIENPIEVQVKVDGKELTMELDTGSAFSVVSREYWKNTFPHHSLTPANIRLKPYVGPCIVPEGKVTVKLEYRGLRKTMDFLVVDGGGPPLLGRDWCKMFEADASLLNQIGSQPCDLQGILKKQHTLFEEGVGRLRNFKAQLRLKEGAVPKFFKPRPVPFALKEKIENELSRLVKEGILVPAVSSEWATPIVPVVKKDGGIRICADYKVTLNPSLVVEQYPLPRTEELMAKLAGGQRYSKIDLRYAFLQIEMDEESQQMCTINTHVGLFRVTRLPFGVASSPAIFQRKMDELFGSIPQVQPFQDDIIFTGKDDAEHLSRLNQVLEVAADNGLKLAKDKCSFLQDSVEYLGHSIDSEGVRPLPSKTDAIAKAPTPTDVRQLRSFLGAVNYYGKFVPHLATRLHPLHCLLQKDVPWRWTKECQSAFDAIKEHLCGDSVLTHFDSKAEIELMTDASSYGIGAVLIQVDKHGEKRPIAFASRTLTRSETNYAQLDKEALGIVFGVKKFHQYLFGRKFVLWTDHKPLVSIFGSNYGIPGTLAPRMQRWVLFLTGYNPTVKFVRTENNQVADMLSRLPLTTRPTPEVPDEVECLQLKIFEDLPVTAQQIRVLTRRDPALSRALEFTRKGWPENVTDEELKPFFRRRCELTIEQDCLLWGMRVIVPSSLRRRVMEELHEGHVGASRMKSLARMHVWWPKLDEQIEDAARLCRSCQESKSNPPLALLHPWEWPTKPWQRLHADFAGPFHGKTFLLIVDAHSKWPEVFVMNKTTSEETIHQMRTTLARFGLPERLVTDNGTQFTSKEFEQFVRKCAIKHTFSAPGHPATNGAAENFVGTFKDKMKAHIKDGCSIDEAIIRFLGSYRCVPHNTTGRPPAELMLGRLPSTLLDVMKASDQGIVRVKQERQQASGGRRENMFLNGDRVWVRDFRRGRKWTEAKILSQPGSRSFVVRTIDGCEWRRHLDQVRTAGPTVDLPPHPSKHRNDSDDEPVEWETAINPSESAMRSPSGSAVPAEPTIQENSPSGAPEPASPPSPEKTLLASQHPRGTPRAEAVLRRSSRVVKPPQRLDL